MIKQTGPDEAPASTVDTPTSAQPEHLSPNNHEHFNLQELDLRSPLLQTLQVNEGLATRTITPALVVTSGSRTFDTGVSIKVEALTVAA